MTQANAPAKVAEETPEPAEKPLDLLYEARFIFSHVEQLRRQWLKIRYTVKEQRFFAIAAESAKWVKAAKTLEPPGK